MSGYVILGSAVVGLLVGMTGAGGGALMTPMLVLLFSVKPSAAISSDLVAAVVMRPFGAAVHLRRGTVNRRLVGLMAVGSVPAAFLGSWLLHVMEHTASATADIKEALGAALLLGAAAIALRYLIDRRTGNERTADLDSVALRPLATAAIGMVGGLVVGLTSVGSGSLMIVMLMFVYPGLAAKRLVGTDLAQAIPLTAAAALGALTFGHVEVPLTGAIVVGSVPAVLVGSLLSSRTADGALRPLIFFVILASGLKYVGLTDTQMAWVVGLPAGALLVNAVFSPRRPARSQTPADHVNDHPQEVAAAPLADGPLGPMVLPMRRADQASEPSHH